MNVRLCLAALLLLMTTSLGAGERLMVRVSPSVSFAPATLIIRAMIEADAANRGMAVTAESADFYRSSEIDLDGDRAPRTSTFEFRSLPSGTYLVRAVLLGADGETRAQVRSQVAVIASGLAR